MIKLSNFIDISIRKTPNIRPGFSKGFTIVELLVVIVVIAILAAITIVSYNTISKRATEATMSTDLRNSSTALEIYKSMNNGYYPVSATEAVDGRGLTASGSNVLTYTGFNGGYCVSVSNSKTDQPKYLDSVIGQIQNGTCGTILSTLAGSSSYGYVDGKASSARFNSPTGLALTSGGEALVPDAGCGCIRKISASGVVTTHFMRPGPMGSQGDAQITTSPNGDFYLSDWTGCISKVTAAGVMTNLAGVCTFPLATGSTDGTGSAARFNNPQAITQDASGNLYVADANNNLIRKITPAGVVTTIAGSPVAGSFADGTGSAARFDKPMGIDIDSSGNLYVADAWNYRIRKITPAGQVTTIAGSSTRGRADGTGAAAQFYWPHSITVASNGTLYVGDQSTIRKISTTGEVTTIAGTATSGNADGRPADSRLGSYLWGIDIDSSGAVWVADQNNNIIRKITQ